MLKEIPSCFVTKILKYFLNILSPSDHCGFKENRAVPQYVLAKQPL